MLIGLVTIIVLMFTKKIPEPIIIPAAEVVGILKHGKVG
jgi:hypothetical protein